MDTKALRKKILDLAIRGKLVPQDPNDEPASVLLERIREKKKQMVKEGKLKAKDIKNDSVIFVGEDNLHYEKFTDGSVKCIEDEIPFELPEGWVWERLSNLAVFSGGKTPSTSHREYWNGDALWVTSKDMKSKYITSSQLRLSALGAEQMRVYQPDTLLLVTRSGILRHTLPVAILKEYATINQDLKAIILYMPELTEYIYACLKGMESQLLLKYTKSGTTVENVNFDEFQRVLLPMAPLQEVDKIVTTISEATYVVSSIEDDKVLMVEYTTKAKSKILDLAIRGKLVPQNPDDEPASVLLERIRAEKEVLIKQGKIKCDKRESVIFKGEDNSYYRNKKGQLICIYKALPYELPDGWTWAMLPEVVFFQEGPGILKKDFRENGVPLIRISGLQTEKVLLTGCDYLDEEMVKNKWEHFKLDLGDIILCTSASIGKASIVGYEAVGAIPYTGQIRFKMSEAIIRDYFLYFATSSVYLGQVNKMKTGNCIQHYGPTHLKEVYVPLPPINEQEKIADKLKVIFSQFNSLESTLA